MTIYNNIHTDIKFGNSYPGWRSLSRECQQTLFIETAKHLHGDKYGYSKVFYEKNKKVILECPVHGDFEISAWNHIKLKSGCQRCSYEDTGKKLTKSTEQFVAEAQLVYGDKYDYSKSIYTTAHQLIIITCPEHGDFSVSAANHLFARSECLGCTAKSMSINEQFIAKWLVDHNIDFIAQKTFSDFYRLSRRSRLKFDFYIPSKNLAIEYDGEHHYLPISFSKKWTGEEHLLITQERDSFKNEYAASKGIILCRIRYDEDVSKRLAEIFSFA